MDYVLNIPIDEFLQWIAEDNDRNKLEAALRKKAIQ